MKEITIFSMLDKWKLPAEVPDSSLINMELPSYYHLKLLYPQLRPIEQLCYEFKDKIRETIDIEKPLLPRGIYIDTERVFWSMLTNIMPDSCSLKQLLKVCEMCKERGDVIGDYQGTKKHLRCK
jgi:hypothetical protein